MNLRVMQKLSWMEIPQDQKFEEDDDVLFTRPLLHIDIPVILYNGMPPSPEYETVLSNIPAGTRGKISEIEEEYEALVSFDLDFQDHNGAAVLLCAYLVPLSFLHKI